MVNPKVSVIIPVYNVEQYIEKCARSLFSQTLYEMEFIFIDDCSPDKSISIVREVLKDYPQRTEQVRFIKMPKNSGTGAVRRRGQYEASGEYIIHCDSDDWVDTDYYKTLYSIAIKENSDIVISDFKRESKTGSLTIKCNPTSSPLDTIYNMPQDSFYCMLWNKLIRRNLLINNDISTVSGIDMWEDVIVTLKAYYFANKVSKAEGVFYHYFLNPDSYTSRGGSEESYLQRQKCIIVLSEFFSNKKGDWSLLLDFLKMLAKFYLLKPDNFNPYKWRREFPEAIKNVKQMRAFSKSDLRHMHLAAKSSILATLYAFPSLSLAKFKHLIKNLIR